MKKVIATGHQPRKGGTSLGDWRPSPSQQSAAVKPTHVEPAHVEPAQDGEQVNLLKAEVGDTVVFRGGKSLLVKSVSPSTHPVYTVALTLDGFGSSPYTEDGRYMDDMESDYDIIKHIPAEEDNDEMTLRDRFAMSAITGLTGGPLATDNSARVLAELAYLIAGRMMEARKDNKEND